MKTYYINLDYESFLFDPQYQANAAKNLIAIKEFEYVFFLVNQEECKLKNVKDYSLSYLEFLKSQQFKLPALDANSLNFVNWWGRKDNIELEKKLNSKITSSEIAQKNNWGFLEGKIVNNLDEVEDHLKKLSNYNFLLKNPFSFSGIGHTYFEKGKIPLVQFRGPMLLEPVYQRICDIGFTYVQEAGEFKREFIVLNFNNEKGSFKGGMGFKSIEFAKNYIATEFGFHLNDQHLKNYHDIVLEYKKLGATENIQVDSFIYKDSQTGELKIYQLVEVNYRKTMGFVIDSLCQHYKKDNLEFRITHTAQYENQRDWLKLSPENNKFNSYIKLN